MKVCSCAFYLEEIVYGEGMAETTSEPPLWVLQLENRQKRQHRLAHEIGAGAPCLKCVDSCPGLDLHFWRKLCRNCRCRKEDHEVTDDDYYLQFEILLCSGDKTRKRVQKAVLDLNIPALNEKPGSKPLIDKIPEKKSVTLDWVPPGIPLDLAAEYMQKLPATKLPITGSSGALYRKQQFEKQLPRHDLTVGLCHELTTNEIEEFQKYLDQIKSNVVGQGKVEKLTGLTLHQQIAEITNQNLQKPQWAGNLKNVNWTAKPFSNPPEVLPKPNYGDKTAMPPSSYPKFSLKSPSDFISGNKLGNTVPLNQSNLNNNIESDPTMNFNHEDNAISVSDFNMNDGERPGSIIPPYSAVTDKITSDKHLAMSSLVPGQKVSSPLFRQRNQSSQIHQYRDPSDVSSGIDSNEYHATENSVSQLPFDALRIFDSKQNVFVEHSDPVNLQNPSFSEQLRNKVGLINQHNVPQLLHDPKSDSIQDEGNTFEGTPANYDHRVRLRCQQCNNEIQTGEVVVSIDRSEKSSYWHPQCFICTSCEELLVDLVYFFHKNKVYCGRHYAEIVKIPRCFACDELIFVKQYTVAEGENFHIRHFCCLECDVPLAGKEYIPVDNHPICIECFNKKYAKVCLACQKIIEPADRRVSVKEMHWHATDACFSCGGCKRSLLQSKIVFNQQKPYCNRNCVIAAQETLL